MAERRYTLVFYGAVLLAATATWGAYRTIAAMRAGARIATQPVVVANKDLPEGIAIDRLALSTRQWPVATVPAGAFSSLDSAVGRVTRVAVFAGEPIVPGRLAPSGSGPGLEIKIPPGQRAMAVRINDVAGISGLLQPNSRVDVMVTLASGMSTTDKQIAKVFMENMRVLSVGTEVQRGADGKPISATTVTLGVTPQEAERLAVAMNQGSIQLVLRGYGDPDSVKTSGATSSDVLAQLRSGALAPRVAAVQPAVRRAGPRRVAVQAAPAPPVVAPRPVQPDSVVVQVYRGGKPTREKFEKGSVAVSSKEPGQTP